MNLFVLRLVNENVDCKDTLRVLFMGSGTLKPVAVQKLLNLKVKLSAFNLSLEAVQDQNTANMLTKFLAG